MPLIVWRVGRGAISAWYDTWLEDTPLAKISTQVVRWRLPLVEHLKLNVDGAVRGNPRLAGGGGILRDHTESIIFAFSYFYNIQTNIAVEAMAIRDSLLLYEERNLHDIIVESDSRVLVQMLGAGSCSHWRLQST
ncbi:unnamed protein product [Spirodela intermedia]|uniref:RNase H type-1 domain-containing protein n=1 Tax=Spirodela intermedia TaxID=51605 RepID=A0A7I8IXI9_SPIIN|nr:unnamed protein product [Spirodela intermedia]CAA6662395.1 unnamed protein product [Spirodela intermedia]